MTGYCGNCQFFEPGSGRWEDTNEHVLGTCHRGPPAGLATYPKGGAWPETYVDGWCGEFRDTGNVAVDWKAKRVAAVEAEKERNSQWLREYEARKTAKAQSAKWWWQR